MGRPLTTLRRYSGICSIVSGVPWASRRTACLATRRLQPELAHHLHHRLHILDWRSRHDSVAEIEDVPCAPAGSTQNLPHSRLQNLMRRKQSDRVEISLHRAAVTHRAPALVERLPPVEADYVRARRSHLPRSEEH